MSIDRADDRLLDGIGQLGPAFDEIVTVRFGERFGTHLVDIGAGCEGFMGAGEDHGADGGVFVEGFEGGIELEDERCEEGVEGFRAVKLDCVLC